MTEQDQGTSAEKPEAGANASEQSSRPPKRLENGRAGRIVGVVVTIVVLVLLVVGIIYFTRALRTRPTVVPSVLRMTEPAAGTQLSASGFQVGRVSEVATGNVGVGLVVTQKPVGNATAPKGSPVDLTIAVAPINTSAPKLIGMTQAEAVALLESQLFIPGRYREYSDKVPAGTVAEQLPEPGVPVQTGTRIIISVSLGSGTGSTVPDIVGLSQAKATEALVKAGVTPLWTYSTFSGTSAAVGTVIDQAPNPGTVVPAGENVAAIVTVAAQ